jgi:chorismate dehydratase
VCAVSYLNTVPLVWGMLHGPQRDEFDLNFALPAECAEQLKDGRAGIGIVPAAALLDQPLEIFRGSGIACRGPVRSILMISRVPFDRVRTLATDSSSRSSVLLSRIILMRRYGVQPKLTPMEPRMAEMLEAADACLIIGDPALLLDPDELRKSGFFVADLGEEWVAMTGLPMVFAVWAGQHDLLTPERERAFVESREFGLNHIGDIVAAEHTRRGVTSELAHEYLTRHIAFDLGEREYAGMDLYLRYAAGIVHSQPAEIEAAR